MEASAVDFPSAHILQPKTKLEICAVAVWNGMSGWNAIDVKAFHLVGDSLGNCGSLPQPSQGLLIQHMGQFLQGKNFCCFVSYFLKVEPSCD